MKQLDDIERRIEHLEDIIMKNNALLQNINRKLDDNVLSKEIQYASEKQKNYIIVLFKQKTKESNLDSYYVLQQKAKMEEYLQRTIQYATDKDNSFIITKTEAKIIIDKLKKI